MAFRSERGPSLLRRAFVPRLPPRTPCPVRGILIGFRFPPSLMLAEAADTPTAALAFGIKIPHPRLGIFSWDLELNGPVIFFEAPVSEFGHSARAVGYFDFCSRLTSHHFRIAL